MQRQRSFVRRLPCAALAATTLIAVVTLLGAAAADPVPSSAPPDATRVAAAADPAPSSEAPDAARLLFLVEYVGADYGRAVRDGVVVSELEYGEMLRFTRDAVGEYAKGGRRGDDIARALDSLAADVEKRAGERTVRDASRSLSRLIASSLEGVPSPASPPDAASGAALFAAECASCHGDRGAGDGLLAKGLDPAPADFREEAMAHLTRRYIFSTLTFGIDGTGMPSYAEKLNEEKRWDVAAYVTTLRDGHKASDSEAAKPAMDSLSTAMQLQDAFGVAAGRVSPSVVGVASFARVDGAAAAKQDGWQQAPRAPEGTRLLHAGSGFFVGDGRDVATSDHLLRNDDGSVAEVIRIHLGDGTELDARVVGMEPTLDLAIVSIARDDWKRTEPSLSFADSDGVRTGNWLVALGDPPGARTSLAVGVASAPARRECYQEERSATMLQSSLAIDESSFGGPVADIEGNVVGMAVRLPAIPATPAAPAQPGHTAILPANLLRNLHAALEASRTTESPWLGVSVLELDLLRAQLGDRAASRQFPAKGVFIDNVFEPSPATRAGVRRGDFLLTLGTTDVGSVADFQRALYSAAIGKEVQLRLHRAGKPLEVTATVELRPSEAAMR
jgi:S1-C subfamily serine protease